MTKKTKKRKKSEDCYLIYGLYAELLEGLKHHDTIQTAYRTFASTILLASFTAIGFLYLPHRAAIFPFINSLGVVFVCVISLAIITLICFLDLVFQERLIIANVAECLKLENENKWLPRFVHNVNYGVYRVLLPTRKIVFYIGCASCILILLGLTVMHLLFEEDIHGSILVMLSTAVAIILYSMIMHKIVGNSKKLLDRFSTVSKK